MQKLATLVLAVVVSSPAAADDLTGDRNEPGKINRIRKGVWEIDGGALGILTYSHDGDATSTQISTHGMASVQRFIADNVSVGAAVLVSFVDQDHESSAQQFGGGLVATLHLRLGQGAFLRPGIAVGVLGSSREIRMSETEVETVPNVAGVVRLKFPLAYFTSRSWVLEAGPQVDISAGTYQPTGDDRHTYVQVAGGFGIGVGYAF